MKLTPWKPRSNWIDPFDPFENLQKEMNRLFNNALSKNNTFADDGGGWLPAVDIYDEKDRIRVKADLPGLDKDNIDIIAEDDMLTIKGERKEEKETKEEGCVRSERRYGSFYRSFALPRGIDTQKIDASFKDGVLEIILPKTEEAKPKQIKVDIK